jgi:hypothetical protein
MVNERGEIKKYDSEGRQSLQGCPPSLMRDRCIKYTISFGILRFNADVNPPLSIKAGTVGNLLVVHLSLLSLLHQNLES